MLALTFMCTAETLPADPPSPKLFPGIALRSVLSHFDGPCNNHKTLGSHFLYFLSKGSGESHERDTIAHSLSETISCPRFPVTMAGHPRV